MKILFISLILGIVYTFKPQKANLEANPATPVLSDARVADLYSTDLTTLAGPNGMIPNCKQIYITPFGHYCNVCEDTYYKTPGDLSCDPCADNCYNCTGNATNCTSCRNGMSLDSATKVCFSCIQNCASCLDGATCSQCNPFYFVGPSQTCNQCSAGCEICPNTDTCILCGKGQDAVNNTSTKVITCQAQDNHNSFFLAVVLSLLAVGIIAPICSFIFVKKFKNAKGGLPALEINAPLNN